MKPVGFRYNIDLSRHFSDVAYRLTDSASINQGCHYHDGYEIIQTWSDKGCVLIDGHIYPMEPGCIYLINALDSHCTSPSPDAPYIRSKITFSAPYIRGILEQMGHLSLLHPFSDGQSSIHMIVPDENMMWEFDRLFKSIFIESTDSNSNEGLSGGSALMNAWLIEMLVYISRWNKSLSPSHKHRSTVDENVRNAMEYINRNYAQDVSIDRICENLHLSRYYLCHLFKRVTGLTMMQYLLERRITSAKKMLTSTNTKISDIAMDAGFSSFSLFCRSFKEITGFTPKAYRRRFGTL